MNYLLNSITSRFTLYIAINIDLGPYIMQVIEVDPTGDNPNSNGYVNYTENNREDGQFGQEYIFDLLLLKRLTINCPGQFFCCL